MKINRRKAFLSFLLTAVLLVSFAASAFAADASIDFKGFHDGFLFSPGSEYTETDLFDSFKNVMPGDVLTEKITFTNSSDDCDFVNLFIRAQAHDEAENPLSPNAAASGETVATMAEFLSRLSMKVWNGTELIYDASPNETGGLQENQFLGTFRSGDTAVLTVELTVPASLGNEYANRLGEVDWVFHAEAWNEDQLTVRKVWSDGNINHANDSITVNLMKDGEFERSVVLSAENQWVFTFDKLTEGHSWTAEEADIPDGYTVHYNTIGNTVTIVNIAPTFDPGKQIDLSVKKVWDNGGKAHPDFATVTLYNGSTAVETVKLNEENDWSYKWVELPETGNWQIVETNIPKGYTPSYSAKNGVITVTNTATLIKTGQLFWPIPLLIGAGLLLISLGGVAIFRKKKYHV